MNTLLRFLKRLICTHDFEYIGEHNTVHVHICKKCGKTVTEIL